MNGTQKKRRQLWGMYKRQNGRCYFCRVNMAPPGSFTSKRGVQPPPNLCTFEHMHSRANRLRGQFKGEFINVASCVRCNALRNVEEHVMMPLEEKHRRSGYNDGRLRGGVLEMETGSDVSLAVQLDTRKRAASDGGSAFSLAARLRLRD